MALTIQQIAVAGYDDNFSYVIYDTGSKEALVIDPSGSIEEVFNYIEANKLQVKGVVLTHTHFDHFDRLEPTLERFAVPVYVHASGRGAVSTHTVTELRDEMQIKLSGGVIIVLHTPGHTPDSICLFIDDEQTDDGNPKLISGDTLFVEGCGRTDSAGVVDLYASLQRLTRLPDETEVYPGHDYGSQPYSTIGWEKVHNRFLLVPDFARFKALRLS